MKLTIHQKNILREREERRTKQKQSMQNYPSMSKAQELEGTIEGIDVDYQDADQGEPPIKTI